MAQHSPEHVLEQTRAYVKENFLYMRGDADIGAEDPLLQKGIIDSMGALELLEFLQSQFGLKIEDEEVTEDNLGSLARITNFVLAKQGATA